MPHRPATAHGPAQAACDRLAKILESALVQESHSAATAIKPDHVVVPITQFALGLVRMRIQPALEPSWLTQDPVHVAMFGGTNSGKSTVLNLLLGRSAAGMSARARFSQHPEAYRLAALGNRFLDAYPSRFPGYAKYFDRHPPRQDDDALIRDGYRPAIALIDPTRIAAAALAPPATRGAVIWDIPDFSTEEAQKYLSAVFDTVALADLVVMTLTRENYADHRSALLRALVIDSGVQMRVVANKLEPGSALLDDIQRKLADGVTASRVGPDSISPLPQVAGIDEAACLESLLATPQADVLRRRVADEITRGTDLKRQALRGAIGFLDRRLDEALAPLWNEVAQARRWSQLVDQLAETHFYGRYKREYLDGEKYVDFNQTLVKLMDLLEIPGIGGIIAGVSKGLKVVSQFVVRSIVTGFRMVFTRGDSAARKGPELEVVALAFEDWIDSLRAQAQVLAEREQNPAWARIHKTLEDPDFMHDYGDALGAAYQSYRQRMDQVTGTRARALFDLISKKPALLNTLRGLKVTLDVGTTALIVSSGGLNWTDAVIGPLVAPLQRLILEFGLDQYLATQKMQLKQDQQAALREVADQRMIAPIRNLYPTAIDQAALAAARTDLNTLRAHAETLIGSERP